MGLRALFNVSKEQQNKLTPMQTRVKGAPRSMNDPQAKTAPAKEAIEEVLRQCESPLLAYAIKMVRDGEQAQEIVQDVASPLAGVSVGQARRPASRTAIHRLRSTRDSGGAVRSCLRGEPVRVRL